MGRVRFGGRPRGSLEPRGVSAGQMAWWRRAQRASGDRDRVWGCVDVSSRSPELKKGLGVTRTLFCVHSSRWEKVECVGVLAGRIPLRTGEQPPVGGGRVGLGTGWVGVLTAGGKAPCRHPFPSQTGKGGDKRKECCGGNRRCPLEGWVVRSLVGWKSRGPDVLLLPQERISIQMNT